MLSIPIPTIKEDVVATTLGKVKVYELSITATVDDVTYPKQKLYVRRDNYLLLKVLNYSKSQKLLLTQYYPKYTKIKGKYIPIQGYNIDELEKGNKTVFQIQNISTKPISKNVFTKAYLETLSR